MVQRDIDNPLTEEDLERINQGIEDANKLQRAIEKAQQCGFEMGERSEENRRRRQQLIAVKNTYFPGR